MLLSATRGGEPGAQWVVLATVKTASGQRLGVPVLEPGCGDLRRWTTLDGALTEAYEDSAVRLGGGWAIHLESGAIERIEPQRRDGAIHTPIP